MASRHVSTGAEQKKLMTYGLPSRRRHHSNLASAPQSSPVSSRMLEPSDKSATTVGNGQSTITPSKRGGPKTTHGRNNATSIKPETTQSCQRNDELRKRNHSAAFDVGFTSEVTVSSSNFRARDRNISQQPPRGSYEGSINGSESASFATRSAAARGLTMPFSAKPTWLDVKDGELAPKRPIDSPGRKKRLASPPQPRRRRLIDALTAQRADSPDSETCQSDCSAQSIGSEHESGSQVQQQSPVVKGDTQSRRIDSRGMTLKGKKIRLTYSQSRSFLSNSDKPETPDIGDYATGNDSVVSATSRLSTPPRPPSVCEDIEEDINPKLSIQSVHELRRAGANNRFSDEMDDLLFRIGNPTPSPSTMRRNGLCELVHMLQNEDFANQFRDHASRDSIAKGIRGEEDILSGFALAAVLVIFLSSSPAPHMLQQLAEDRIGVWLGRLLAVQEDITVIALQRSMNLPRATRTSLTDVKKILLQMRIWHGYKVVHLSPRTVALQLLAILIRCSDTRYVRSFLMDSGQGVAKLADYYAKKESADDVDFALTISILEAQSSLVAVINEPVARMQRQESRVAAFLQRTLQRWPSKRSDLDATLLKLAINTTNNKAGAETFDDVDLVSSLTDCICFGFEFVQDAMRNARFEGGIYDELLLILGIMINVLEHFPSARVAADGRPLENLVALWLKNQLLMNEADSVEKSKLSVALGYLAVLVGYLYLGRSSWTRTRYHAGWPTVRSLVKSIQEFIRMHRSVDSRVHELEGLVCELQHQD